MRPSPLNFSRPIATLDSRHFCEYKRKTEINYANSAFKARAGGTGDLVGGRLATLYDAPDQGHHERNGGRNEQEKSGEPERHIIALRHVEHGTYK